MVRKFSLTLMLACAVLLALAVGAGNALADPIGPGFDLFVTDSTTTFANLGTVANPLIVPLRGVQLGTVMGVNLWDTDTVVQRLQGIDPLPVGGSGMVQIQLRAVMLTSIEPVAIGGGLYNVRVLGGDLLGITTSPLGTMTVVHSDPNGGTFAAILPVTTEVFFDPITGPTINPVMRTDEFTSNGFWSHTPRPDDVHTDEVPPFPAGRFYGGVDPVTGGKRLTPEEAMLAAHGVLPAQTPEPSTLLLLLSAGVAGFMAFGRRRLSKGRKDCHVGIGEGR
jgi:hypothetical protein